MIKSSIIILIVIVGIAVFFYFAKYKNNNKILPENNPITESRIIDKNTWATRNENNWDPTVIRTWATVVDSSGVSVTVITNWPDMRTMTPEEEIEFEKKTKNN